MDQRSFCANLGIEQTQLQEESIIEILLRIEENQQKFFSEALSLLRNDRVHSKDDDLDLSKWGDILDVQKLLKRSRRTVYRILDENVIQSMPVRGTTLYYLPDFLKIKIKGSCLEKTKIHP